MVIICIAKGCENKQRTYTNVMLHRIPSNVELRNKWLATLEICTSTPLYKIKQYRVCKEHFAPEENGIWAQKDSTTSETYGCPHPIYFQSTGRTKCTCKLSFITLPYFNLSLYSVVR